MLRVLHCPTSTGGNPHHLARAERALGVHSIAVAWWQDVFAFPTDEVLCRPTAHPLQREALRFVLLWRVLRDYDIVHFNFGQTLMPQAVTSRGQTTLKYPRWWYWVYGPYARLLEMRDLPLLKRAGKGIVVTYQGDDARQGDFCLTHFDISPASHVEPGYYTPLSDAYKRRRIKKIAQYADRVYALNPDLLHVLPARAEFLPYTNVNLCEWVPEPTQGGQAKRLTLLHAPTQRNVKGTRYILAAVQRLREHDRLDFEFLLVEGLPHDEARRLYRRADLLVDQVLVGWYGGLAVEFMALGKPVICYIREDDLKFIPVQMRRDMPIIQATPTTLYDVLKECLTRHRDRLQDIGQWSRAYVEQWHDPLKVAAHLKQEYEAILAAKRWKDAHVSGAS
jgi:glycosyltransferase involved in cell wall biosynthesis